MRSRSLLWLLIIGSTLLFVISVWTDAIPLLRGPEEWGWTLRTLTQPVWRLLLPLAILALYAIAAARWISNFPIDSTRPTRRAEWGFLVFLTVAAPLIQLVLAAAVWHRPLFEFFANTTSPSVTGYYSVAVTTPDLPANLPGYADFMLTLPIHPQTHPPGLIVLHWLAWRGFTSAPDLASSLAMPLRTLQCQNAALMSLDNAQLASAVIGMIIPIIGGLTVWPLYALGRRLIGTRQAALAAAIFPVLPTFVMWPAQWDQVFPLFLLTGLYLVQTGLEARSTWRFILSGIVFSCVTFLNFGNMIMVVIAVLYIIVWWLMQVSGRGLFGREAMRGWGGQLLAFAAGCTTIWLIYLLVYRVPPIDLLTMGERLLLEGTRCPICPSTNRTYNVWVVWNVIDFAILLSLPISIVLLARLPALLKTSYAAVRRPGIVAWAPLTIAALSIFVVLDLAGIVRGEVSRLWAFFGPLFVLLALAPVQANVDFARQIKLVGADLKAASDSLDLKLYWQALTQPPHAYTVFVHVLDAEGNLIAQQDNMPVHDQLLTSCWQPGEQVSDPHTIALPAQGRQPASIDVGLYRLDTGERLARDDGAGTTWSIKVAPQ